MYSTTIKYDDTITEAFFPIIAFDPGTFIGVAWADGFRGEGGVWNIYVDTSVVIWPSLTAVSDIEGGITLAKIVSAEEFKIYAHKAQALAWDGVPAARVLGFIEAMALKYDRPFVSYMAAQAKTVVTDDFMRERLISGAVPRNRHERDALRHLWLALLNLKKIGEKHANRLSN
jgi:hypothetical protein